MGCESWDSGDRDIRELTVSSGNPRWLLWGCASWDALTSTLHCVIRRKRDSERMIDASRSSDSWTEPEAGLRNHSVRAHPHDLTLLTCLSILCR